MTWIDAWLNAALFLATTLYACGLERHTAALEPDHTVWEVVFGTALVLLVPIVSVWQQPWLSGWQAIQRVCVAFIVGGTPIIIWQVWQALRRRDRAIAYLRRRSHGDATAPVAESRRREEGTDQGSR